MMVIVALLTGLLAGCGTSEPEPPPVAVPATTPVVVPSGTSAPSTTLWATAPTTAAPGQQDRVPAIAGGEIVHVLVRHAGTALIDARSSGLAHYASSPLCEVPGRPCYTAPTLGDVARIDIGAPPETPGTQTTFITGHSNRYHPDNRSTGVFSRLQEVVTGDEVEVTTTRGRFTYHVDEVLRVPFDRLPSTDAVVRVRKNTLVAISCEIAPDRASYPGNFVVVAGLASATPV